jgi:hypothetical protein
MAIDERARHHLFLRLEEHLGAEAATTLMEHLPPTGWSEVATKRDLDHLAVATKRDLDHLQEITEAHFDQLGAQLRVEMRDVALDLQKTISKQTWMIAFTMFSAAVAAAFSAIGLR